MSTAPWDPSTAELYTAAHAQQFTVTFTTAAGTPIPVDVSTAEVTMDRSWSPYCQGVITGPVPDDQAILDALDPRRMVRCTVTAGYVLTNGVQDVHPLAVLYLAARDVDRPSNTLTLSVQGPEFVWDRYIPNSPASICPGVSNLQGYDDNALSDDAVAYSLAVITGASTIDAATIPPAGFDKAGAVSVAGWGWKTSEPEALPEIYRPSYGQASLDFLREIAARIEAWFYCDELGIWHLTYPPGPGSAVALLQVGATGTIIDSVTEMTRDDWANHVNIVWTWDTNKLVVGYSEVISGPYTPAAAGRVTYYEDRDTPITQAIATRVCRTILKKLAPGGRIITLTSAAAYWVRPYDTVTIQLPTGPQERHQVASVTYRLHEGSMQLTTFLPIDPASIGG